MSDSRINEKPETDSQPGAGRESPTSRKSPPKVYLPSCGVLCDVFWWARRKDEPPPPSSEK